MGLDQTVTLIFAVLGVVSGTYVLIDGYGGWPIFWYDLKNYFLHKK